ncbi:MAG: diphthine--ammonia ligase, partial [Nanoarchaeota archaeon]|nr:diphthine--ammonia ligase [Nanoarchaeota archaeon]
MKLGILLSGGKDSLLAATIAKRYHELACAITVLSLNDASYMFHVPNVELTGLQATAMGIPHVTMETKGEKEDELKDLKKAIKEAKEEFGIEGIVTGAVCSQYQATRIQKICNELDLYVFNPLWQMDQIELLETLLKNNFKVVIAGVFAYPFDDTWLGREIDSVVIQELEKLMREYRINPSGEGGEIETLVLDCPLFRKQIIIED